MRALAAAAIAIALVGCRSTPPAAPIISNRPEAWTEGGVTLRGAITKDSLYELMTSRFSRQIAEGTFAAEWNGTEEDVIAELTAMGWTDIADVARAIPRDLEVRGAVQFTTGNPANIPGTLRDVMILHDAQRYFTKAWNNHWASLAPGDLQVYRAYGIDLAPIHAAGVTRGDGS